MLSFLEVDNLKLAAIVNSNLRELFGLEIIYRGARWRFISTFSTLKSVVIVFYAICCIFM